MFRALFVKEWLELRALRWVEELHLLTLTGDFRCDIGPAGAARFLTCPERFRSFARPGASRILPGARERVTVAPMRKTQRRFQRRSS